MKVLSRIVLAVVAAGSCAAAGAQYSDSADKERRARNREEAIANHERMQQRAEVRHNSRRDKTPDANPTVGQKIDKGARATNDFTHRQLNKVRNFGERQQNKFAAPNPGTPEPDKAPHAIGK